MLDQRGRLLMAALGFANLRLVSHHPGHILPGAEVSDEEGRIGYVRFRRAAPGTFGNSLGIVIREASRDRVVAELEVREGLKTSCGALHGGAIMTLADTLTANATFLNLPVGATTATIECKTNFFAATREGKVIAETRPLHRGRRTMVWQTRVTNPAGRLLALVIQTQAVIEPSRLLVKLALPASLGTTRLGRRCRPRTTGRLLT